MSSATAANSVQLLADALSGRVLVPGDPGYDEARRIHNGLIDKRPAVIARCLHTADVVRCGHSRQGEGLEISVRGGGHNVAGRAVTEGGLMIDLSLMKGIHVDPAAIHGPSAGGRHRRRARPRRRRLRARRPERRRLEHRDRRPHARRGYRVADGRCTGWPSTTCCPPRSCSRRARSSPPARTPIATCSGRSRGRRQLRRGDVVRVPRAPGARASWAAWCCTRSRRRPQLFSFYREFTADLPDELATQAAFLHAPDGSGTKLCGVAVCHAGDDPDRAEADVRPLREFGSPVADMIQRMPYPIVNTGVDWLFPRAGSTTGSRRSSRSSRIPASR